MKDSSEAKQQPGDKQEKARYSWHKLVSIISYTWLNNGLYNNI